MKSAIKLAVFVVAFVIVLPMVVLSWLEKRVARTEAVFVTFSQLLAVVPGPPGVWLRAAYYSGTLTKCSWECHVGFGSHFTHRGATVGWRASMGSYCVIGHADIGAHVMMASRVSVPSGKRQHLDESGNLAPVLRFDRVAIGERCWVGEGAIVLANVGAGSIVSAGAVVIQEMPGDSLIGGNPAKVVKELVRAPAGAAAE